MDAAPRPLLGRAELRVLWLVAEGKTQLEIAEELHYSHAYIRRLAARACEQLGAPNVVAAVAQAFRAGLLR